MIIITEDLERRELAGQERHPLHLAMEPGGLPAGTTAAALARSFVDGHDSSLAAAGTGPAPFLVFRIDAFTHLALATMSGILARTDYRRVSTSL